MRRALLILLCLLVGGVALADPVIRTASSTISCTNVSTTVTIKAAQTGARAQYVIIVTSGTLAAGTIAIYFKEGTGAAVPTGSSWSSLPLAAGQSYTSDGQVIYDGAISAVAATGTVPVCIKTIP